MNVLTVNPGSSSVKLAVVDDRSHAVISRTYGAEEGSIDVPGLRRLLADAPPINGSAVRLVHGGEMVRSPTLLDETLASQLTALADLAPLHNTAALRALEVLRDVMPETPIVLCVDSAFHATIPEAATTYAIPWEWTQRHGFKKFGFHGLSHGYASRRAASLLERPEESLRLVTCHLGAGASLAAIVGGRSVDTTMGFTPLDGLVMATRSGSVDPGIVTRIQRAEGISAAEVEDQLERHSGLLGISGRSGDFQIVEAAAADGDARSHLAIDVMVHRIVTSIGAMAAAAGGLDALVFTGGIGERSAPMRRNIAVRLGFLGVVLGPANETVSDADVDVSAPEATTHTLVVHTREDLELAREARALLQDRPVS